MFNRDKFFKKIIKNPTPENKYLYSKFRNREVSEQRQVQNKVSSKLFWKA